VKLHPFIGPSGTMMNGGFIYDSKTRRMAEFCANACR
jgi:hypothetical protein